MAIIDSIFLEKASGSIDNLTYYQLNGQQVVRSRNRNPYDPMTPEQLSQRARMSNAVFCYRFLKTWLVPTKPMIVGARTLYNQYTAMFTELFPTVKYTSLYTLLNYLTSTSIGNSNYCIVDSFSLDGLLLTVSFSTMGSQWFEDTKLYVFSTNNLSGNGFLSILSLSEETFNSGVCEIILPDSLTYTIAVHINSIVNNKCSNIKF